jgi:hypothetical protein
MIVPYEVAETIRRKKAQYCRFIDTKQWDSFRALALPDATYIFFDLSGNTLHRFDSPRALIDMTAPFLEGARTSHRVSNSELTRISETKVQSVWAMEDYLLLPPRDGEPASFMRGYGHYHETWTKHGADWFLKSLDLSRTISEAGPLPPLMPALT